MNKKNYVDGLVSVIIPVYKSEKFLKQTIQSVQLQSYQYFEIILIDDCSPDQSFEIISEMRQCDDRICFIRNSKNLGAAISRNKALNEARGRYIAFLDSDDLWVSNKLQFQLDLLKKTDSFFIYGAIEIIDEKGKMIKNCRHVPKHINYNELLRNTAIATSTVLIDRDRIGDFRMPLIRSGEDYATWLMLLHGNKVAYGVQETVVKYRKTRGSLSSKKASNWKKVYNIQVNNEHINPFFALINCLFYIWHAILKYYFK
ncbi:MAG: glycosyltransferase [Spirochaetia bacterium]|jgi:teichuronic acid biosynthesis glycosyltransferase TuaG|nr:glycosyltransferase [Spirochaetia bacterium]